MPPEPLDHPDILPVPPPLLYAGPLLATLMLSRRLPGVPLPSRPRRLLGALLFVAGAGLIASFFRSMQTARTPVDPRKPVAALVTSGPFALSRNPGYLGMAGVYTGLALLFNSLPSLLALPVVLLTVTRGVIEREEAYLDRRFGEEYRRYRAGVRRWL